MHFMEKQHAMADVLKHPTARVLFLCPAAQAAVDPVYILNLPNSVHGMILGGY
jgi:hypothetical protein